MRHLELPLDLYSTTVGFCHLENGCKIAAPKLPGANGIAKSPHNETIYVSSAQSGGIRAFERQSDNTLQLLDFITTGKLRMYHHRPRESADRSFIDYIPVDNLSIDSNGALWGAGKPTHSFSSVMKVGSIERNRVPTRHCSLQASEGPHH